jgi:Peptidase_C39 like family
VGCPACHPTAGRSPARVVHEGITARSQYATPGLIAAVAYSGHDPADDPRWPETGAPSRAEYGRWCRHWCGMACLLMILEHRDGTAPSLHSLLAGSLSFGTYQEQPDETIRGMFYEPFAQYAAAAHGLKAHVHRQLPVSGIRTQLAAGRLVIASVHKEIRRPSLPPPSKGGHLVLITGYDGELLHFRNPSGHTHDARNAALPCDKFTSFYAERAISVST